MPVQGTPISQTHYSARTDTEARFGAVNVAAWFDRDADGNATTIAAAIDAIQTNVDNHIAARAAALRAPIPAVGSALYSELVDYHATTVGLTGYFARGKSLESDKSADEYAAMADEAEDQLTAALLANRGLLGVTGTWDAAPVAIASGTNVAAADRLAPWPYWGTWWPWG